MLDLKHRFILGVAALAAASVATVDALSGHHNPLDIKLRPLAIRPALHGFNEDLIAAGPIIMPLEHAFHIQRRGFRCVASAEFSMRGMVLGRRVRLSGLASGEPVDLLLGWGAMSNPGLIGRINPYLPVWNAGWHVDVGPGIDRYQVLENSIMVRAMPASMLALNDLRGVRRHQVIRIQGHLCSEVSLPDGTPWQPPPGPQEDQRQDRFVLVRSVTRIPYHQM